MDENSTSIYISYVIALVTILTGIFAVIASFVVWQIDRKRLSMVERENIRLSAELESHKKENILTFQEIRESIKSSNQEVVNKLDDLKMYLLQSKITLKGEVEQKEQRPFL